MEKRSKGSQAPVALNPAVPMYRGSYRGRAACVEKQIGFSSLQRSDMSIEERYTRFPRSRGAQCV